jgi:hypothetical protein
LEIKHETKPVKNLKKEVGVMDTLWRSSEQGDLEFKTSLGYFVKPCFKIEQKATLP